MKAFPFRYFLGLSLLGILFFFGCKKDQPDPPVDYLPQDFKDWMCFKEGTYWVYEDSAASQLDSTIVNWSKTEIQDYTGDPGDDKIVKRSVRLSYETYSFASGLTYQYFTGDRCWYPNPDYTKQNCLHTTRYLIQNGQQTLPDQFNYYNAPIN